MLKLVWKYLSYITLIFLFTVSQDFNLDTFDWDFTFRIVRFVAYLLFIEGTNELVHLAIRLKKSKGGIDFFKWLLKYKHKLLLYLMVIGSLLYKKQELIDKDLLFLIIASSVINNPFMDKSCVITYGAGMACSFNEGYLSLILPSDGSNQNTGFIGNINRYEAQENVIFPVRRLFIIITRNLYSPPDLCQLNKQNRPDLTRIEACKSLEDMTRHVAGVRNRVYRNSAYQLVRVGRAPVYLCAECATPLHTLYKVTARRTLYGDMINADVDEIREDFCTMLQHILDNSPDCRNTCELVYYDSEDDSQNLADILLERIKAIQPDFEEIIVSKR